MHLFYLTLLVLFFVVTAPAKGLELIMDCGNQTLFIGEKALCQFILTGEEDRVEVEVAKFPEFRGFWSENLSLRQGAMALVPFPTRFGVIKQTVIGSYSIHRMIDKATSEILPMKISIKKRGSFQKFPSVENSTEYLISKGSAPKMLSLPPIPQKFHSLSFNGAVGEFSIFQTWIETSYRLNEPFAIRISIQGRGNFAEINELAIPLPEGGEIISQRTFTQNSGSGTEKTFEFSVLLKSSPVETFSLGQFLYFDPTKRQYQTLALPNLKFVAAEEKSRGNTESFILPAPEPDWSRAFIWYESALIWWTQALVLLACILYRLVDWKTEKSLQSRESAQFKRREVWDRALKAQEEGDSIRFTQLATALFTELLKQKGQKLNLRISSYPTKRQLFLSAQNAFSQEQQLLIKKLFSQYDEIYSPSKLTETSPHLIQGLKETISKH